MKKTSKKSYFCEGKIMISLLIIKISIMSVKSLMENTAETEDLLEVWRAALICQGIFLKSFLLN